MDAGSSLCGHLVAHVYCMPQESLINKNKLKRSERERGCSSRLCCLYLVWLGNRTSFSWCCVALEFFEVFLLAQYYNSCGCVTIPVDVQ